MTAQELDFQADEYLTPPGTLRAWQGEDARTFRSCVAAEFNNLVITAEQMSNARNPLKCDPTILPYHGRDRRIRRYDTETEISWRRRLAKWKQIHASAGRAWGLLRQLRIFLQPYGRPMLRIVSSASDGAQAQWFTLEPGDPRRDYFQIGGLDPEFSRHVQTPSNWLWDFDAIDGFAWSRFWVLINTSGITPTVATSEWDDVATWDDGAYWDGVFTSAQIGGIVDLLNDWKAAQSMLAGLFLVHDDTAFDPTGTGSLYPGGDWDLLVDPTTGAPTRREGVTYSYVNPNA